MESPINHSEILHLTTKELAERWRMKPDTLEHWRIRGDGPKFIRFGGRKVLYPITEVEAFERACMHTSVSCQLPLDD